MTIDIGTGDGRFVLAAAGSSPRRLVIGVDASADAMVEASRRASGPPRRGGLPNALFVIAAAEALPRELDVLASDVTIHFPWGSLLRGIVGADPGILGGIARICRPGAAIRMLVSVTERDHVGPIDAPTIDHLAGTAAAVGLVLCNARLAGVEEIAASHSTWAKRLAAGSLRPVWSLDWERAPGPR